MPDCKLPGDTVFVCSMGLLYTELYRVAPNAEGFSGVLPSKTEKVSQMKFIFFLSKL